MPHRGFEIRCEICGCAGVGTVGYSPNLNKWNLTEPACPRAACSLPRNRNCSGQSMQFFPARTIDYIFISTGDRSEMDTESVMGQYHPAQARDNSRRSAESGQQRRTEAVVDVMLHGLGCDHHIANRQFVH